MANVRDPRDGVSREKTARSVYVPPSSLPDPTPSADWVYRWVATHVMGQLEHTNASKRFREGWTPVKAADHPELAYAGDKNGNVEVGGLMLCKMPRELAESRDRYYEAQAEAQVRSVDSTFMGNSDPRMPLFSEKKTETSRGGGFGNGTK